MFEMGRGEVYIQYGSLPEKTAVQILSNFKEAALWKEGCKVLDIGCGPGNVTHDILYPILPKSTSEIVGVDKCPEFIEYARNNYEEKPIFSFRVLDIVNDEVPEELEQKFDYAVSFLCFHQFSDHKAAFENVSKMLKPGGEILFYFAAKASTFQLYETLANNEKLSGYFPDWEKYCSPYKDSLNIKKDIENFVNKMGYKILSLRIDKKHHSFPMKYFQQLQQSLVPLPLPDDFFSEIRNDMLIAIRNLKLSKIDGNSEEYFEFIGNIAILHAVKA
ncbi:hypothetical protein PPYR_10013 [Photinus pyralis]|uniref:Methyltransferase domain-containing protein n=1 Tax=Photinus pyralis TaxID=7054 RepID=A0A5N4AF49_PHOPY|nr:juvenile hormone acid O-methyltransferase-like [Photinus pyralis]KAB0795952.1 hypothetical protein PPYR_10013 [Photinus pyralis]